jgi:hypothetical protein
VHKVACGRIRARLLAIDEGVAVRRAVDWIHDFEARARGTSDDEKSGPKPVSR